MRNALRMASLSIVLSTGVLPACAPEPVPGARLWRKRCSACHGPDGAGRTRFAEGRPFADLTDGRWKHGPDRDSLRRLVADGDPASTMPPFAGRLTPAEIDAVVDHALTLAAAGPKGAKP
jgi:cytochrome c oxidase cbb3-type subunit 3